MPAYAPRNTQLAALDMIALYADFDNLWPRYRQLVNAIHPGVWAGLNESQMAAILRGDVEYHELEKLVSKRRKQHDRC